MLAVAIYKKDIGELRRLYRKDQKIKSPNVNLVFKTKDNEFNATPLSFLILSYCGDKDTWNIFNEFLKLKPNLNK
jgi:hypothetical protein